MAVEIKSISGFDMIIYKSLSKIKVYAINENKHTTLTVKRTSLYFGLILLTSIILGKLFSIDFLKYLLFIQNLLFLSISNEYFSIAWSLSVEEWFYIFFSIVFNFNS